MKQDRFLNIDILRGIAAIVVMFHHYFFIVGLEFNLPQIFPTIFKHGYLSVELFFIISGFVIFYSVYNSKSAKQFLIKRCIRLFPAYWACIICTFLVLSIFPISASRNPNFKDLLIGLTMFNGLFKSVKAVDPSYWSLLIEWFFYFLMATYLFFSVDKKFFKNYLWLWIAIIWFYNAFYKIPVLGVILNLRYGGFFITGIVSFYIWVLKEKTVINYSLLFSAIITSIYAVKDLEYSNFLIPLIFLIFFLFLKQKQLNLTVFEFLGKVSYPLYLIHQNIGFVIIIKLIQLKVPFYIAVIVAITFSIIAGYIIVKYIEKPIAGFLKRKLVLTNAA